MFISSQQVDKTNILLFQKNWGSNSLPILCKYVPFSWHQLQPRCKIEKRRLENSYHILFPYQDIRFFSVANNTIYKEAMNHLRFLDFNLASVTEE